MGGQGPLAPQSPGFATDFVSIRGLRLKTGFSCDLKLFLPVQPTQKINRFGRRAKHRQISAHPVHSGGADHDRHERGTGCGGRLFSRKACAEAADGQAVWSCFPDAGDKPCESSARRRGLKSPVPRGEHGAAVKPLRRECRMSRPCLTDLWAFFLFSPRGLRVRPAPGIPCALRLLRGTRFSQSSGVSASRECQGVCQTGSTVRRAISAASA